MQWMVAVALVLAVQGGANKGASDPPPVEQAAGPASALDRMTMGQMMRLAALPEARLNEARCAGMATWRARQGRMDPSRAARFRDAVVAAVAHDADFPPDLAAAFVDAFADQITEQQRDESAAAFADWLAGAEAQCADLLATVERDAPPALHPLNNAALVDPALAGCHALYVVAAERANGEEQAGLRRQAEEARTLALAGKSGEGRSAAEGALAAEVAAARAHPIGEEDRAMMRLVACLPILKDAAK